MYCFMNPVLRFFYNSVELTTELILNSEEKTLHS